MDIMELVSKAMEALKGDNNLLAGFIKDPIGAIKSIIGVDIPDDMVNNVVGTVKDQLTGEGFDLSGIVSGAADGLKDMVSGAADAAGDLKDKAEGAVEEGADEAKGILGAAADVFKKLF